MSDISLAIETSCREGGVALGRGDELIASISLGDSGRHAAGLLPACDTLLTEAGLTPADVGSLYVSAGPGSFTGLRVGLTAGRTWAQQFPGMTVVSVPTVLAVAQNIIDQPWEHLGVLLAAKENQAYGALVTRNDAGLVTLAGQPMLATLAEHLADWPASTILTGEALGFIETGDTAKHIDSADWFPRVESVWQVGRALAAAGKTTAWPELLPIYARQAEAVRLWEKRHASSS